MKKHIIVAPHADDEIIGCFSILKQGNVRQVLYGSYNALEESQKAIDYFGFEALQWRAHPLENLPMAAGVNEGLLFLPDPVYEAHPDHREFGQLGEWFLRRGYPNVVFYSVNMTAPYIRKADKPDEKLLVLNHCYEEKKDLWEYDHKYYLFEGQIRWLTTNYFI